MTHCLNVLAFDRERNLQMTREIRHKDLNGFNLTIPKHCVSSNYPIKFRKFGYSPRLSRVINPFRLGFANEFVETHFNYPFEAIGITEAQKYLNSRMSIYFPEWQSRWYEQHGHNSLDIFLDTQRPMLIDVNIRELASFVEIVNLKIFYNEYGKVCKLRWKIRRIENSSLFERYMASGKSDKSCYKEEYVTANYNVFALYDSQNCKPKFYAGHLEEDFDIRESNEVEDTIEGYMRYLEDVDDEMPKNFYQRRKST